MFLVSESPRTQEAYANAMRAIGAVVGAIHEFSQKPEVRQLDKANDDMARVLRDFQTATSARIGPVVCGLRPVVVGGRRSMVHCSHVRG